MRSRSTAVRWPFWLLIAAWFCANVPSTVMSGALSWAGDAGHFSHNGRLKQSVAALLAGESEVSPAAAPDEHRAPPVAPAVEHSPRKTLLALTSPSPAVVGAAVPASRPVGALQPAADPARVVPHPPPRAA